jgi:transposase-like protein
VKLGWRSSRGPSRSTSPVSAATARASADWGLPVSGLLKRGDEVRVILPLNCSERHLLGVNLENVVLDSRVYSDGWKAYNKLSVNGFQHSRINHDKSLVDGKVPVHCFENFWGYAKRRQIACHGGFKRNFRLFIRERSFRFNHRNDEDTLDDLQDALLNWSERLHDAFFIIRERIAAERETGLEKLEGPLEVDEPCFGGHRQGKRGGEVRVILRPKCSERQLPGSILAILAILEILTILENTASGLSTVSRTCGATPRSG